MFPLTAIPWRLIGAVGLVAAVSFAGWRVNTWHTAYGVLRSTQAQLEAEQGCEPGSKCAARVRLVTDETTNTHFSLATREHSTCSTHATLSSARGLREPAALPVPDTFYFILTSPE